MKFSMQEQTGRFCLIWQMEFCPHGDGMHGFLSKSRSSTGSSKYWQETNGSPRNPWGQLQIGLWFTTWQFALTPQVPGHGSIHFWLAQAWLREHSLLTIHSGWQKGGDPLYCGRHEQTATLDDMRHRLFGPQGDGSHGFNGTIGVCLTSVQATNASPECVGGQ